MAMKRFARAGFPLATLLLILGTSSASALTGEDVIDRMSSDQRSSYLFGAMEMAAFLAAVEGDEERSQCIPDWFHDQDGLKEIILTLEEFKERSAMPIIHTLFRRACGA